MATGRSKTLVHQGHGVWIESLGAKEGIILTRVSQSHALYASWLNAFSVKMDWSLFGSSSEIGTARFGKEDIEAALWC